MFVGLAVGVIACEQKNRQQLQVLRDIGLVQFRLFRVKQLFGLRLNVGELEFAFVEFG